MLSDAAAAPTDSVAGIIFLCFFQTSKHQNILSMNILKKKLFPNYEVLDHLPHSCNHLPHSWKFKCQC